MPNSIQPQRLGHPILIGTGIVAISFAALLAGRLTWEETFLTYEMGPQMIGFSLIHGTYAPLILAPVLLTLWVLVAAIVAIVLMIRRRSVARSLWICLAASFLVFGALSIPSVSWQWLFVSTFAKSPNAAALMTYASAEGDLRTVQAYLAHGVPIESKNYDGSTAAFLAAATGRTDLLVWLANQGSDLNAVNAYGDSPLQAAIGNNHQSAADLLKSRGAIQKKGTEEQREAASHAIVARDMERMNSGR